MSLNTIYLKKVLFLLAILLTGLLIGSAIPNVVKLLETLGQRIPQNDIAYDYLSGLLTALLILISIPFWFISNEDKKVLIHLWLARCLVTLFFMLVYEYQYGLDAYGYFIASQAGDVNFDLLKIGDGTTNIEILTWCVNKLLLFHNSFHAQKVVFSFVGLLATYLVYRAGVMFIGKTDKRFLYALGLYPSILFWSSILGKDPVNMLGVALYFYGVVGFHKERKMKYVLYLSLGLLIAMMIRVWSGLILMTPFGIIAIQSAKNYLVKIVLVLACMGAFTFGYQKVVDKFKVSDSQSLVKSTHGLSRSWSRGGSGQEVPEFKSLGQMLAFAPIGMFTALFRPLPGEILNLFGLLAGFENFILLYLLLSSLKRTGLRVFKDPIVLWATSLIIFWSFIYGFISYQNLGAAVRFKLQVLPVLFSLVMYLVYQSKNYSASNLENTQHVRHQWSY